MATLTWLHLSDLHFNGANKSPDQSIVLKALRSDIEQCMHEYGLKPDFVAVTGDIAQAGAEADYLLAETFFNDLLATTGLPRSRLFVVPGNHDVDWNAITRVTDGIFTKVVDRDSMREFLATTEKRQLVFKKFSNYAAFVKRYFGGDLPFSDERTFFTQRLDLANKRVALVGLNSAWLARGGDEDLKKLALCEYQMREALEQAGDADVRIAFMHHPCEWLAEWDRQTCEALLSNNVGKGNTGCDFILHGHLHRSGAVGLSGPDMQAMVIAAGACYETRQHPNAYNFVRLDFEAGQGVVYLRTYSDVGVGHWTRDVATYQNTPEGSYTFHLKRKAAGGKPKAKKRPVLVAFSPEPDDTAALQRYLKYVIDANQCLQLQGIGSAGELVRIGLEDIYITLTATVRRNVVDEEALVREMGKLAVGEAARAASRGEIDRRETKTQVQVKVQEALAQERRLVVLGDPGCGKTTLLRYLALTYARDLSSESGLVEERLQLKERRQPILLPLRDFARNLQARHPDAGLDGPRLLLDYLREYFANQAITLPERFFADRLSHGECAVLLDGVDEVADLALRQRVARLIDRFTLAYPDNRYVVTSRIVGYTGTARLAEGYALTTVRDFSQVDIERFVTAWNLAVETALAGGGTDYALGQARQRTEKLLAAIKDNERIRELAINPLLLTVIALVQRYRADLPERRSELYEEAVEVLLGHWDRGKGLDGRAGIASRELDAGDLRGFLEPVALWMMENQARGTEADALRGQLVDRFQAMTPTLVDAKKATSDFLALIAERSGLLAERGQGVYAFSHLTFQEHLAARAIADRKDYIEYTLARLGDSWWRETILLEAGYLSTQGKQRVTAVIKAIMDCQDESEPYHNLVLAAQCLRDVGSARVEGDLGAELQCRLRRVFEQPLRPSASSHAARRHSPAFADAIRNRAAAAEALAHIESGGDGVGPAFWRLPYGEPVWADVPAGEFWMGSEGKESNADEQPIHPVYLAHFEIARVPITNAQYRLFVEATKHETPVCWEGSRLPRQGGGRSLESEESHPVTGISWHDAMAYCAWLSEVTDKSITLPSEAQWEKAARGDRDRREYPWGDAWDETRCNCADLGLGETSPVGIFPDGASPYGCLDMAGNAWEWTRSLWRADLGGPTYSYPYKSEDGRENVASRTSSLVSLRGGGYHCFKEGARCSARNGDFPIGHLWNIGFRVVMART